MFPGCCVSILPESKINMSPVYRDTKSGLILTLQLRSTLCMSYSIAATHVLRPACNIKAETDNVLPHRISFKCRYVNNRFYDLQLFYLFFTVRKTKRELLRTCNRFYYFSKSAFQRFHLKLCN